MTTKFFVVDTNTNHVIGTYDSQDAAAGACQAAVIEHAQHGECDDETRYEVAEAGSVDIEVVGPSLGDVADEEYEAECDRLERCYSRLETDTLYSVIVRPCRGGEADGTYERRASGDLQILGYSLEIPEALSDLSSAAFELFCSDAEI